MDSFKKGDIATIVNPSPSMFDEDMSRFNGEEVIVVAELESKLSAIGDIRRMYEVALSTGRLMCCWPHELKKKPPEEEIDWVEKLELKSWSPTKQGIEV